MSLEIEWVFESSDPTTPPLIIGGMRVRSDGLVLPEAETKQAGDTIGHRPVISYRHLIIGINEWVSSGANQSVEIIFEETNESLLLTKVQSNQITIGYSSIYKNVDKCRSDETDIRTGFEELKLALLDCYERLATFARQNNVPITGHMRMLEWETKASQRML